MRYADSDSDESHGLSSSSHINRPPGRVPVTWIRPGPVGGSRFTQGNLATEFRRSQSVGISRGLSDRDSATREPRPALVQCAG